VRLCAVCAVHKETRSASFLVEPKNQGQWFFSGLTSKPLGRVSWLSFKTKVNGLSVVWPQNHWGRFPGLGLKTGSYRLVIWASKITTTASWFEPQNEAGYGLFVASQNR
jgi:hypothetical protein